MKKAVSIFHVMWQIHSGDQRQIRLFSASDWLREKVSSRKKVGCHRSGGSFASIKTFPFLFLSSSSPSLALPRSYRAFPGRRSFLLSIASYLDHPFVGLFFFSSS